jgi:beta-lactamase regulating signal transducer with metallopeptidase domain
MIVNNFHGFFLHVFFGFAFIFPLIFMCFKVFNIYHPKQRMSFYILGLLMPFASFVLFYTFLTKRCQKTLYTNHVHDILCQISTSIVYVIGPLILGMMVIGLLKLMGSLVYIRRLRSYAVEPTERQRSQVLSIIGKFCYDWDIPIPGIIFTNRNRFAAMVMGIYKPVIIMNKPLIEQLTDQELEIILTHELIHIRRKDHLMGWVFHLVRNFMFFSPFSTLLLKGYLVERERICDEETVKIFGDARIYAATLLKVWRLLMDGQEKRIQPLVGFIGKNNEIEYRITKLLSKEPLKRSRNTTLIKLSLSLLMLVFLGFIC